MSNPESYSPRELAEILNVSESSVRRWADKGSLSGRKTAGGHRRFTWEDIVKYAAEHNIRLEAGECKPSPEHQEVMTPGDQALMEALRVGDADTALKLVMRLRLAGHSVAQICDGPLRLVMHELGECWLTDRRGVLVEHRATSICVHLLAHLRGTLTNVATNGPFACGCAPSKDPYLLPSMMAACTLAELGYRELNLGADTPLDVLVKAAEEGKAHLAWVSISSAMPDGFWGELVDAARQLRRIGCVLVVGGRELKKEQIAKANNIHVAATMTELNDYAATLAASLRVGGSANSTS